MQFKKLLLSFIPFFFINSVLPMWRQAADNITQISCSIIDDILRHNPETAQQFVQPVIDNITQIHYKIARSILQKKPEAAELFVQPALDSIAQINPGIVGEILKRKPEAAELFVQPVIDNITQIRPSIVYDILEWKPEAVELFIQPAIDNITQIDSWIVGEILEKMPEAAELFVQPAIDNINQIHYKIIRSILQRKPEAIDLFVQPAIDNITQIDPGIVSLILQRKPEAAELFVQPAIDNITQVHYKIVRSILQRKPEATELFIQPAIDNITQVHYKIVRSILQKIPEATELFAQPAIDNITQIDYMIVQDILGRKPEATELFIQPAIDNITQIDPWIVFLILQRKPEAVKLFVQLALDNIDAIHSDLLVELPLECNDKTKEALVQLQQKESDDLNTFFKILILSKKICKQQNCRIKCCTQTCRHLRNNFNRLRCSFSQLFEMANKVNQKEKELQKEYYTFVHGQRWEYQFAEHLFTKLYEWTNKKECPEFLFAHMKKLPKDLDEENLHEELLKKGRTTAESRQRLLFLNYAFFGNSSNLGSSTAYYVANNRNAGGAKIDLQELFEWNDLEDIYLKYESELIKLQEEHNSLSRFGNLLMVAVPKDIVDKCIFPATIGGYKKKVDIMASKTDKTSDILEAIKEDAITNSDEIEFCLAMTRAKHGGLNEDSGIKFFDINGVDEEKWKAYKEKEEAILEKIKADILASQAENKEVAIT